MCLLIVLTVSTLSSAIPAGEFSLAPVQPTPDEIVQRTGTVRTEHRMRGDRGLLGHETTSWPQGYDQAWGDRLNRWAGSVRPPVRGLGCQRHLAYSLEMLPPASLGQARARCVLCIHVGDSEALEEGRSIARVVANPR